MGDRVSGQNHRDYVTSGTHRWVLDRCAGHWPAVLGQGHSKHRLRILQDRVYKWPSYLNHVFLSISVKIFYKNRLPNQYDNKISEI